MFSKWAKKKQLVEACKGRKAANAAYKACKKKTGMDSFAFLSCCNPTTYYDVLVPAAKVLLQAKSYSLDLHTPAGWSMHYPTESFRSAMLMRATT